MHCTINNDGIQFLDPTVTVGIQNRKQNQSIQTPNPTVAVDIAPMEIDPNMPLQKLKPTVGVGVQNQKQIQSNMTVGVGIQIPKETQSIMTVGVGIQNLDPMIQNLVSTVGVGIEPMLNESNMQDLKPTVGVDIQNAIDIGSIIPNQITIESTIESDNLDVSEIMAQCMLCQRYVNQNQLYKHVEHHLPWTCTVCGLIIRTIAKIETHLPCYDD